MRNIKKECEWQKTTYKRYEVRLRKDNGDSDKLDKLLKSKGISFSQLIKSLIND